MAGDVYVSPPRTCECLADMLLRFGGTHDLRHSAPLSRLPGGRVFGAGAVLAPDGQTLARDVSTDFGKPFNQHWLLTYAKMPPPQRVPGTTAVVAVTLGDGYCHWLLEELPRLLMIEEGSCETIIAHTRARFVRDALALARRRERFIEAARYSHFECERLLIPSLVDQPGRPTLGTVETLNAFVAPLRPSAVSPFGERLYITREKARRRRLHNEAELWRELEPRGFVKIVAEELPWPEQIIAFSQARVIVAPHGAGLANLVFCQPGARVVEFFNRAYVNPCFQHLASVNCIEYQAIIADDVSAGDNRPANQRDIHVSPSCVLETLGKM